MKAEKEVTWLMVEDSSRGKNNGAHRKNEEKYTVT